MKILITGANGLLGQKLVSFLGHDPQKIVLATGQGPCRILHLPENVRYQTMDISQEAEVRQVILDFRPQVIIHAAALTNVDTCELEPEKCQLLNVTATKYIISAAEATNGHLIHLSTDFIFDGEHGPYDEAAEARPISIYGQSKLDAETAVMAAHCPWAIVRTILVFGIAPGLSRGNIILWVKENLEKGKQIQVVDDQFRTPTLAEDLADGCIRIANQKATGIFNIGGKELLTPYAMALETAAFFHLDASLINKATAATFSQPARRPPQTGLVIDKAREILGYDPHSFHEGIAILARQLSAGEQ